MADAKISAFTELAVSPDPLDEFVVVDKSDTTMAASGTTKRIKAGTLLNPPFANWKPTGAKIETFPRWAVAGTGAQLTSGTLYLYALAEPLRAGVTYTSISWMNGAGGTIATATHQWFTLVNLADMKTLRSTTDDTNVAWAANAVKTLNLSSTYAPATDINAYVGIMVAAATTPNMKVTGTSTTQLQGLAPILGGTSSTSQTAPPSDATTMTSLSALASLAYAYVS